MHPLNLTITVGDPVVLNFVSGFRSMTSILKAFTTIGRIKWLGGWSANAEMWLQGFLSPQIMGWQLTPLPLSQLWKVKPPAVEVRRRPLWYCHCGLWVFSSSNWSQICGSNFLLLLIFFLTFLWFVSCVYTIKYKANFFKNISLNMPCPTCCLCESTSIW